MRRFVLLLVLLAAACDAPELFKPSSPAGGAGSGAGPISNSPAKFENVGTLGAWTRARALDDQGDVVGESSPSTYGAYPILSQNGAIQQLEMFGTAADAPMSGGAGAINAHATIAGIAGTNGLWYVTVWDSGGGRPAQQTAIPASPAADVVKINDAGAVLAWWQNTNGRPQAILVTNGAVQSLGSLSSIGWTDATDLNRTGQVVGRSAVVYEPAPDSVPDATIDTNSAWFVHHPFLWDGAMHDLGVFGRGTHCERSHPCASGMALAINSAGDVVGYSEDSALVQRPFLWRNGVLQDIGVFPGQPAVARAINDRGQIAGDGNGVAFLWENGATQILGSLGGGYTEVTGMNAAGDVVGTALTPSGEQHAFIWTGGRMIDLGLGLADACAARATAVNGRGDVLIAVMRQCFHNLADQRLTNFDYDRPQLAVLWRHP